jgi:hypothetical protein
MDIASCEVLANNGQLFTNPEECVQSANDFAFILQEEGYYARPGCFELNVGEPV